MPSDYESVRLKMLNLLETTRQETNAVISRLDPNLLIHTDERRWRMRDILGHLGVWNMEAARSLKAYAEGGEYTCVPSEATYYDYNGLAADERKAWSMEQVWAEYDQAHDEFKQLVAVLPHEKWDGEMLYPWNSRGNAARLIEIMMKHETVDHCQLIIYAIS